MKPGIYDNMSEDEYHADPVPGGSLSHSGAKVIYGRTPLHFRAPRIDTPVLMFGRAVHTKVLGVGAEVVSYGPNLTTKAAREARDEALAAGLTPVSDKELEAANAMAEKVLAHPLARRILERPGKAEQSLFTVDETGIWRRSRLDWMPDIDSPVRPILADYKTARNAGPREFGNAAAEYDYPGQGAWYLADFVAHGGDPEAAFVFIVQEKEPPYVVAVYEVMPEDLAAGHAYNRAAIARFAECRATDTWPGYTDDHIKPLEVPGWYRACAPIEGEAS